MDDFFTRKHKTLDRIAKAANIIAWIVLIFHFLAASGRLVEVSRWIAPSVYVVIKSNPWQFIYNVMAILREILLGAVYWLVLRGVALGLNMLIETDLNIRQRAEAVDHE